MNYSVFQTSDGTAMGKRTPGVAVAATVYSDPWSGIRADGASMSVDWTGTAAGNLQLWFSNKKEPNRANDTDWRQDTTFGTAGNVALGGAPGTFGDNMGNAKARWWRLKLSGGSGSGIITAEVCVPRNS
jgi:hypothetical protein